MAVGTARLLKDHRYREEQADVGGSVLPTDPQQLFLASGPVPQVAVLSRGSLRALLTPRGCGMERV